MILNFSGEGRGGRFFHFISLLRVRSGAITWKTIHIAFHHLNEL